MSLVRLGVPGRARFHTPVLPLAHGKHLIQQQAMPRVGEARRWTISYHSDIPFTEKPRVSGGEVLTPEDPASEQQNQLAGL